MLTSDVLSTSVPAGNNSELVVEIFSPVTGSLNRFGIEITLGSSVPSMGGIWGSVSGCPWLETSRFTTTLNLAHLQSLNHLGMLLQVRNQLLNWNAAFISLRPHSCYESEAIS